MAATKATGGVLSHRSAARLHGVMRTDHGPVHVTTTSGAHGRAGIDVHRGRMGPDEVTTVHGIPVTTLARTLLDIAETEREHTLHKALDNAFDRNLYDRRDVERVLRRHRNRHGARRLKRALGDNRDGAYRGENPVEDLLVPVLRRHRLPLPDTQVAMTLSDGTPIRPDALWPERRLIAEIDGGSHLNPRHTRKDLRRDALLQAAGWRVLRIGTDELEREPVLVAAAIRCALGA